MLRRHTVLAYCLLLLIARGGLAQVGHVSYTVEYKADVRDRCFISMTLAGKPQSIVTLAIPAWSPGSYELRPYHKRIVDVSATAADGTALKVSREDNLHWKVVTEGKPWPINVRYDRLEMVDSFMDNGASAERTRDYSWLQPPATFLYVTDALRVPHDVTFTVPEGWLVQMSLPRSGTPSRFSAPDYDTFADAPIEIGLLTVHRFTVGDATYSIVFDRRDKSLKLRSLEELLRRLIRHYVGMFGGKAPYAEYQFQIHEGPGYGLEHLSSTTIGVPLAMLRLSPGIFDSLFAHEYFHLWNVKRIRPKVLGPFDYTQPVRTKALWLSEGVTDYYADFGCWRTGIWNDTKFLETIAGEIQKLQSTPARRTESVEDASHSAFDRGYGDFGSMRVVDYYNKGKLIGLCLDLLIRDKTDGKKTLDDVMRFLLAKYGLPKPGFEEDALPKDFQEATGVDLSAFFKDCVSGTAELPYAQVFETVGIDYAGGGADPAKSRRWIERSKAEWDGDAIRLTEVYSRLKRAGLEVDDRIVEIDGAKPLRAESRPDAPSPLLALLPKPGEDATTVTVLRKSAKVVVRIAWPTSEEMSLTKSGKPTPKQVERFKQWKSDPYTDLVAPGETLDTVGVPDPASRK